MPTYIIYLKTTTPILKIKDNNLIHDHKRHTSNTNDFPLRGTLQYAAKETGIEREGKVPLQIRRVQ